jgi:hypothetical protein
MCTDATLQPGAELTTVEIVNSGDSDRTIRVCCLHSLDGCRNPLLAKSITEHIADEFVAEAEEDVERKLKRNDVVGGDDEKGCVLLRLSVEGGARSGGGETARSDITKCDQAERTGMSSRCRTQPEHGVQERPVTVQEHHSSVRQLLREYERLQHTPDCCVRG